MLYLVNHEWKILFKMETILAETNTMYKMKKKGYFFVKENKNYMYKKSIIKLKLMFLYTLHIILYDVQFVITQRIMALGLKGHVSFRELV